MTDKAVTEQESAGTRVLVAEDEFLVVLGLEEDLRAHGFVLVGPFATLAEVRVAVACERFDMALLDINLGGEMIFPVVDDLKARGTPIIFLSGYNSGAVPERYRDSLRLDKPYDPARLIAALNDVAGKRAQVASSKELGVP